MKLERFKKSQGLALLLESLKRQISVAASGRFLDGFQIEGRTRRAIVRMAVADLRGLKRKVLDDLESLKPKRKGGIDEN